MIPDLLDSNNRPTLLEIAKRVPKQKRKPGRPAATPEELIDLSLAWARGDVTTGQCIAATGYSDSNLYGHIASCFRAVVQSGRLVDSQTPRGWR